MRIPNNKFVSRLPDAARAPRESAAMSRGGGSFQSETEQIRSKETSTNCLLAKHRCIGEKEREQEREREAGSRGSHQSPQHKAAEARARTRHHRIADVL